MSQLEYAGLNTTLRLYEAQLLSQSDYDTLLQMDQIDSVLDYLAKTAYVVNEQARTQRQFEPTIQQRLEYVYHELAQASPDPRVIEIFSLRYTYHNLKVLIKQNYVDRDLSDLLIPIGSHSYDQLKQMVETKGQDEDIDPIMQAAIYDAITSVEDTGDTYSIDVILDTAYLDHIASNARELNDLAVIEFTKMKIDFQNLTTFVRGYNQGQSNTFIYTALSGQGGVSRDDILENWREKDLSGLVETFHRADYLIDLDQVWDQLNNSEVDSAFINRVIQEQFAKNLRPYSFEAFGPMPVLTYLYFLENETDNIRLLLIGKENNLDAQLIKERMRPIHGI